MRIGINASFCRKPQTGIGQVTTSFLKKLIAKELKSAKQKNESEYILYLEEDLPKDFVLPKNFQKRTLLPLYRRDDLIRKIWWEKYLLPRHVKKDSCDVFFSLYQCPTTLSGRAKHLMLVHDIIPSLFPEYLDNARRKHYQKLTEKAIAKADKILTVSKRTEKDLIQHLQIPADRISTNYISIDDVYGKLASAETSKKVLKKYKLNPGYIFAGGGMEIRKNISGVIQAYKLLLDKNKNLPFITELPKLVIYGKPLPNLSLAIDAEKLVKELNLTKQVKFLGAVPQEHLPALFKNAALFVYPSHYEGFGMQILEAMSQGTPAIASKSSSLPEVGLDSILYCHADDTREISLVMKKVLTDKHLRDTLSQRGRERAKLFSWDKFVRRFYGVIEVIGNKGH
ncbi:MAG: glycosyltransferase family 1 protein [Candidatus Moranbacteria bacterium]|nr:glycosyltransferase family 1 protein [Candidatus Moranbacteria bacterium]